MGITGKVGELAGKFQDGVKASSVSIVGMILKVITAVVLSLTLTLIFQEAMGFGDFSFVFLMIIFSTGIFKLMAKWGTGSVLIFDLVCVLIGMLLRMYILIAP